MSARLFCKTGALSGSEYHIGEDATIGRGAENDITLPPDAVSGQHARIFFDDDEGCYVLEDLDSSNGTQLDDTEVIAPVPLKDLHVITFARELDFIFLAASETAAASSAEGAKTQLGAAPEPPSTLPGEDAPKGERTRIGQGPGAPPGLSDEESTPEVGEEDTTEEDRTQFGESPPEIPDLSDEEEPEEGESEGERTRRMEETPGGLPDLPDEEPTSEPEEEDPTEEEGRTRFGESPPELPDLSEEDAPEDKRTRIGGMGEPPSELPPEEPEGDESDEDEHTQRGADAPVLPNFPEGEPSAEKDPADEASPQYALQVILEGTPQGTHSLPEGEVLIGRSSDCDIQIEDPGVSRQHARLIVKPGEVVVEDVGSKNFTFVNEERLTGPTPLSPGAEIQFGLQAKALLQRTSA
ncbi:MAG: FHA domain-containing protein [Salinibacter sp.]|uniref:FHA domain-containing protein n=1 Tax=Salinibacter sp. TaxID=2065818 RepID=UPI0035D44F4D